MALLDASVSTITSFFRSKITRMGSVKKLVFSS
jgi:hypothetical protein